MKLSASRWGLLVASLALLSGCGAAEQQAAGQGPPPGVPVKVATVKVEPVADATSYVATLISRRSVTLSPRVDGQITKILVRAGDTVAAGAPLLQIDPASEQADLAAAEAAVRASRAELDSANQVLRSNEAERVSRLANLRLAKQQFDRYQSLRAEGAVSQESVDQFRNSYEAARASVDAIDAQIRSQKALIRRNEGSLRQSEASRNQRQVQVDFYQISAPFAGTVGDIPVKEGDYVSTATRLLNVTANRPLEVNLSVPAERSGQLRKGMSVELVDERGNVVGDSRVFFISPNVDTGNQTVLIKALYDNREGRLRADQVMLARVIWDRKPGVVIPATAITRVADQNFVFVAQQNEGKLVARQRPVQLGDIQGQDYQVLAGLKPQERVVTAGILKLADGAPIVVQP